MADGTLRHGFGGLDWAIVILCTLALGWIGWTWPDAPGWTVGGLVVIATGHALFLGAEFMLMHRVNRSDPSPRATWPQLGRAWLGESLQAPRVFGWRQPFRTQAWPDQEVPAVAGALPGELPGVVLVHGFFCNRAFWNPWLQRLHATGQPHVAVTLEPVFGGTLAASGSAPVCFRPSIRPTAAAGTGRMPIPAAASVLLPQ